MKRKRRQRWIAMLLTIAMLSGTLESTGLAQSLAAETGTETAAAQTETESGEKETERELPERVKNWTGEYETVTSQEDAEALRTQDENKNLLIMAQDCTLSGLKYAEIVATGAGELDLSDVHATMLSAEGPKEVQLQGTELDQLTIHTEENQSVTLHMDADTKIPEIILEGSGSVLMEGNGALGMVRITGALKQVTVRATCSVLNESEQKIQLETPDGSQMDLAVGQQEELVLSSYMVTFMTDGKVYDSKAVKPGETIPFPEENPEKEGYIFTTWYTDEAFTESCSQFATAEGETVLYARFVKESESIKVTFDSMGGRELEPQIFAKGETLLDRPVNEIYTEKEGYTFGGWCTDQGCTTAFSYTEPLEESMTLYAFFVSDEAQKSEKDGTSADLKDFDWQGSILLRTDKDMTLEEVKKNVRVEAGSGALDPELDITQTEDGFAVSGSYYEKDGKTGFEPGATFSIIVSGGVYFSDYPDETDTAVVSVYKERVEVVGFSEDMTYVLWDDVLEYTPVVSPDEETEEAETESESEMLSETESVSETDSILETDTEGIRETLTEAETESETVLSDPDGESAKEQEEEAYIPGELLVKDTTSYQEGDIVAFYDGEIGRDEKNIDAYTEGSFDGYVLFAQILSVEDTDDGVHLTYGYASPEDYLADFDVHVTDDVAMDQQLSEEDLEVLTSRLSRQVEENEELKAQMLVSVMSAPETQDMLDDLYGEGTYALAGMTATLTPGKPVIKLSVSGSEVTANISISATANIKKDGKNMLTVQPKLSFTQSLSVKTNVDGGKVWIDMSVTIRSMSKIELTVTASTGGKTTVFTKAKDTLSEMVKPEGIVEGEYGSYDESVSDLMDTMNSIVATSLKYNDLFDILLLNLRFSFYGIITVGFEVHLVGQVGVLATFGVEIVARSGERIGFKYNFLKFKGSSYTEKLESSVTNNIYLIGKVGARVGLRLTLSVTMCGIASAYITGSLYAYAELTGLFFNSTNLLSGANTNLGALKFEVGIDVVVSLGLKVKLIIKTIRKNWTVYTGRWPLWSTSISSKMSYMDEDELEKLWEKSSANADKKTVFGFETIPMKTWDLMDGKCQKNSLLCAKASGKGARMILSIQNLKINGEDIPEGDIRNALFQVGDSSKGQNPGYIYMDEKVAEEQVCEEAELDLVVTYENNSSSALVKKQTKTFHLKKKCALATTTHNVKIVLNDWCARNWGLEAAAWDNQVVYETSFSSTHNLGAVFEPTATGTLNLGEIISKVQGDYPEIGQFVCEWSQPGQEPLVQYSVPQISGFCYMTPANGVVRYDVHPQTNSYEATYYLYVRRFEGNEDSIRYHINLKGDDAEDSYEFSVSPNKYESAILFQKEGTHTYLLEAHRAQFDGSSQPLMMSVNGENAVNTGFVVNGREYRQDVYFDITIGKPMLGIQLGEGVKSYQFIRPDSGTDGGVKAGTKVELQVELEEGYGGLEALSENQNVEIQINENKVSFVMPTSDLAIALRAYKLHSITYQYQYGGYGTYKKVYFAENEVTQKIQDPEIAGLTFRGWYTSLDGTGEPYQFGAVLKTDITLYADWTCNVTVHFTPAKGKAAYVTGTEENPEEHLFFENDANEYYQFTYSTLRPGDELLNIQIPEYDGYQFMDWYTDSECTGTPLDMDNFKLTGGVDLYARWAKIVPVYFDRNDGTADSVYDEVDAYNGYKLPVLPDEPQREYYEFTGWYKNQAATDPFEAEEIVTGSITLYAGWKAVEYSITYELGDGKNSEENPKVYTTEDNIDLKAPTRAGYEFMGWTGSDLLEISREVHIPAGSGKDRTYAAVWKTVSYSITYNRTYGNVDENPANYTIEDDEIILKNPVREKYDFAGWKGSGLDTPTMEVHIPTGSMGDRVYTATWISSDPVLNILERIQVLAQENPYEEELVTYLAQNEPVMDDPYAAIDQHVKEDAENYLRKKIEEDGTPGNYLQGEIGAYSDSIEIQITDVRAERNSDAEKQIYQFEVKAVYTDDDGKEHSIILENYRAYLKKMVLERFNVPDVPKGEWGQKLSEITNGNSLGEGYAPYENKELGYEQIASGSYSWDNPDQVPFGRNNGTSKSEYTVIFTPDATCAEYFAPAKTTVSVLTQIGLYAVATADSRKYRYNSTEATGVIKLFYADENGHPTEEKFNDISDFLQGGTWKFETARVEKDKLVTVTEYSLDPEKDTETLYALVNSSAESRADITQVLQNDVTVISPVTEKDSYPYGTELGNIGLKNGTVTYQNDGTPITVAGQWKWKDNTLGDIPDVNSTHTAYFIADDQYENGFAEITVEVSIPLTYKAVPVPEIPDVYYNGRNQKSALSDTEDYTVVQNDGGTDAGSYDVILRLKDTTNCIWVENQGDVQTTLGQEDITRKFTIKKAEPKISIGKVLPIYYGQKLTSGESVKEEVNGVKDVQTKYAAKDMLSGFTVTYPSVSDQTVAGIWIWVTEKDNDGNEILKEKTGDTEKTTDQPLSVKSADGYQIKVRFVPNNNQKNFESAETYVKVEVKKATPYADSAANLDAKEMYQVGTTNNKLSKATISANGVVAHNPYTGDTVEGTWNWADGEIIPHESKEYSAQFTPSDLTNYTENLSKNCKVKLRNYITGTYSIKSNIISIGPVAPGLSSPVFGSISKCSLADPTFSIHVNWNNGGGGLSTADKTTVMKFVSTTVSWTDENGKSITKKVTALGSNTDTLEVTLSGNDFTYRFKEGGFPVNDITVKLEVTGEEKTQSKAGIRKRVAESELTTEAVTEPQAPETNAPETQTPETNPPETVAPETNPPETQAPETNAPETQAPETNPPETQDPETNPPETAAPQTEAPQSVEAQAEKEPESVAQEAES